MSLGFCNPLHGGVVNGPINWKLPHTNTNRSQKFLVLDDSKQYNTLLLVKANISLVVYILTNVLKITQANKFPLSLFVYYC